MNLIMISVPGSGKTTEVSRSISEMIESGIIRPEATYAVTFTREAAKELQERVNNPNVRCCTIHSLAYHLVSSRMTKIELESITPSEMFYDELLIKATAIAQLTEVDMLAVDEAQDLSEIQFMFLKQIASVSKNMLIVGDPWQSIFSFQQSDPKYMGMFKKVKEGIDVKELNISYRIPEEISFYVNNTFDPNVHIHPTRSGGSVNTYIIPEDTIFPTISKKVMEGVESSTGILMRTNREILRLLRLLGDNYGPQYERVNYTVPMSSHPFVPFMSAVIEMGESLRAQDLLLAADLFGGLSWASTRFLNKIRNHRFTREAIEEIFSYDLAEPNTGPDILPIIQSKVKKEVYNLVEFLDVFERFYGRFDEGCVMDLLQSIKNEGMLVEEFWVKGGVTDKEVVEAVRRRTLTRSELYHTVNNGSNIDVMTIHASKGKEFDNVILPVNITSIDIHKQEEFRILYVACTRARKNLSIYVPESYTHDRSRVNVIDVMNRSAGVL
jgi:superfamily I DNA/RNA helicase